MDGRENATSGRDEEKDVPIIQLPPCHRISLTSEATLFPFRLTLALDSARFVVIRVFCFCQKKKNWHEY